MFYLPTNSQMPECGCCSVGSSGDEEVFEEDDIDNASAGAYGENSAVGVDVNATSDGELKMLIIMLLDKTL